MFDLCVSFFFSFFFNDTATTEIYTLSLHDALPILAKRLSPGPFTTHPMTATVMSSTPAYSRRQDRKSTRLNSSHTVISYAVFCLKKKKKKLKRIKSSKNKHQHTTHRTYRYARFHHT